MTNDETPARGDRERLRRTYEHYRADPKVQARWASTNRGNQAILRERLGACDALLAPWWSTRLHPVVLDLGCGSASVLPREVATPVIGADVLFERVQAASEQARHAAYLCADGVALPFASRSIDLVVLFTVLSSVRDHVVQERITAEVDRALRPGGAVLWYDFRYRNPRNRQTVAMPRRRIDELFPGYHLELRSVTVAPQIARRLGRFTTPGYRMLRALPPVRTHLVGLLVKP